MHADQLSLSLPTVRGLVDSQFPDWRDLPVRAVQAQGTVNLLFRIGDEFVARFPLQPGDPARTRRWLESEALAASELLGRTRFRTPTPVAIGDPGDGYPLPWSVQTWLPGPAEGPATDFDTGGSVEFAHDLAEFVQGVRAISIRGRTFRGSGRGGDLRSHDGWMQTCFQRSGQLLDVPRLRARWKILRELPRGATDDKMTHGDLTPGNVLIDGGRLAGVIDVGGLGPTDPSLDLVAAWHLLDPGPRRVLRDDLDCGEQEWARGQAWAFEQAMGLVWYYVDSNPAMSLLGRRTLQRIEADPVATSRARPL